jgi:hypothetical protein
MGDVEPGAAAFVLDQEPAQALEHSRLAVACLHLDNGREVCRRYDRSPGKNETMPVGSDGMGTVEPLLARVGHRSGTLLAGSGALEVVLLEMENRLEATIQAAEAEIRHVDLQVRRRNSELATETRRHLANLRATLLDRATTVARRYDSVLNLLDDADRALEREVAAAPADALGTR